MNRNTSKSKSKQKKKDVEQAEEAVWANIQKGKAGRYLHYYIYITKASSPAEWLDHNPS